jgi:NHLM bacteriocin system ABC transporter peptidase/ATP-binding protein
MNLKKRKVNTPTVFQMEAVECGAASLAMILGYFGRFVPLEQLRLDCGISRNGSKANNIVKAAKKYGLEVKAYSKEPRELDALSLPMIVFWNFYHFIVVEGFTKDRVLINDPASGKRSVTYEEFDKCFTGVVLTFKPGSGFTKGGVKSSFKESLMIRLKPFASTIYFLILTGVALILPNLALPALSKIYIDEVWLKETRNWIAPLLGGIAVTTLLRGVITWIQQKYLVRLEMNLSVRFSAKFLARLLKLPTEFYTQRSPNELGQRLQLNDSIAQMMTGQLANTLLGLLMIIFYAALLASYDLLLALVCLAFSGVNFFALRSFSKKRKDQNQISMMEQGRLYAFSTSGLQMIESIKATASESEFFARWAGLHARQINSQQRLNLLTQTLNLFPVFLSALSSLAVLLIGAVRIMDNQITVGALVAIQSISAGLMAPVNMLVNLGSTLQMIDGNLKRLDDVANYPVDTMSGKEADEKGSGRKIKLEGYLELKNITFGYNRLEPPLISNFSLSLKPGSRVAIVGKTGSGKSTISRLVSGLYKPWEGEILFDGKKRTDIPAVVLQHSISMVDQDIFLFEGTLRENISFWDSTISDKDITQAVKDAEMLDEISARPGGYDCVVEEGGRNFSGGQRQRIDIARALVNKPAIMILDEATSALDAKTEKLIDDNIRKRGCTCLIIAHRLSTIRDCDEIIVLDNGNVVQRGSHEFLKNEPGLYANLIKS